MGLCHLEKTLVVPERVIGIKTESLKHLCGFPFARPFSPQRFRIYCAARNTTEMRPRDTPHIAYDG